MYETHQGVSTFQEVRLKYGMACCILPVESIVTNYSIFFHSCCFISSVLNSLVENIHALGLSFQTDATRTKQYTTLIQFYQTKRLQQSVNLSVLYQHKRFYHTKLVYQR